MKSENRNQIETKISFWALLLAALKIKPLQISITGSLSGDLASLNRSIAASHQQLK